MGINLDAFKTKGDKPDEKPLITEGEVAEKNIRGKELPSSDKEQEDKEKKKRKRGRPKKESVEVEGYSYEDFFEKVIVPSERETIAMSKKYGDLLSFLAKKRGVTKIVLLNHIMANWYESFKDDIQPDLRMDFSDE